MPRILVDKDLAAWKLFQKGISLGLFTPTEIQTIRRRQHWRVSSEVAYGCLVSPCLKQEDLLATSSLSGRSLKVSPPVHGVPLSRHKRQAAYNQASDREVPKPSPNRSRIVTDPSVKFHDCQYQEWEVGEKVTGTWATDRRRIEKINRDAH